MISNVEEAVFGTGALGRTVGGVNAESPPINWTPKNCVWNPINTKTTEPSNQRGNINGYSGGVTGGTSQDFATTGKYKVGGGDVAIPSGFTTYYVDFPTANRLEYDTFNSNPAWDFNLNQASPGVQDVIRPHSHEEFEVNFVRSGLQPETSLQVDVSAPNANLNLDNTRNQGVLQINFNTTQPGVTTLYLIRAY